MKILLKKIPFVFLLLFSLFTVESCQEQDTVKPAPAGQTEPTVVQRITNLGFAADEIKDMGLFYLVDGDVYFSKNETDEEKPESEPARIDDGKYPVFTVRMDNTVSANDNWKGAVGNAIAEWNADKKQHMHFVLTTSTDADITIRDANGELSEEVALASEFAERGQLGSTIRVNMKYTSSMTAGEANEKMLKALFRTTGYHQPKITASNTSSSVAARSADIATDEIDRYLFIIRNDQLVAVKKTATTAYAPIVLSEGWQGSTHMVMGHDKYLYVIQNGILFWADPRNGSWGYVSDGWADAQDMTAALTIDVVYIIDKNRDLYKVGCNSGMKVMIADVWYIGTCRMAALTKGIAISNQSRNIFQFYAFNTGKLTTVWNSTAEMYEGRGDPPNWKNVVAMVRSNVVMDGISVAMKGSPSRLLQCYPQEFPEIGTQIFEESINGYDMSGVKVLASYDTDDRSSLRYFKDGKLWHMPLGDPDSPISLPGGDWQGAFLIACTQSKP